MVNFRLLVYAHLLGTAVLTALSLVLSIRFPYPKAAPWFHLTLALLVLTALATIPLLWSYTGLLWLPPVTFAAATAAFLAFGLAVIRCHLSRPHKYK